MTDKSYVLGAKQVCKENTQLHALEDAC